jgi:hypothetical protein
VAVKAWIYISVSMWLEGIKDQINTNGNDKIILGIFQHNIIIKKKIKLTTETYVERIVHNQHKFIDKSQIFCNTYGRLNQVLLYI